MVLTDPPQVPPGTSAVIITYSNVKVQTAGASNQGWVNVQGSGSVNLLANVNGTSTVIGNANLASNSTVKAVSFTVLSATAVVNGTRYNVTVPNSNIVVNASGNAQTSANSSIIVDFFPTIVTTGSSNSTVYAMNPSATAVVVANAGLGASIGVGSTVSLNSNENAQLSAAAPSISIVSAHVGSVSNSTNTTVVVMNSGASSVVINGVAIYGKENVTAVNSAGASLNLSIGGGLSARAMAAVAITALNTMSFSTTSSGSMQAATTSTSWQGSGYVLSPGSQATFTFNGPVTYNSGSVKAKVIAGMPYKIVVFGGAGASASTTTSASSH